MYAVIDLEGTSGKSGTERIIEVAIYLFDGEQIVDQFISLVNPDGTRIPPFVEKLTGIKNKDVVTAPKFHEVAKRIVEITKDAIIVAHNAPFDYRVLKEEFARLGFDYSRVVMDTIPLAERFIPGLKSYGLASICENLNLTNSRRHRADGDALVTVDLLKILLEKDREQYIHGTFLKQPSATGVHRFTEQITKLVKTTGVYYLFDAAGKVIYLGRSDQLRVRIDRHFLATSDKALAMQKAIASIKVETTGSLLLAEIKAHMDLKRLKPTYNETVDKYQLKRGLVAVESDNAILWDIQPMRHQKPALQVADTKEGLWWIAGMCLRYDKSPEDLAVPEHVKMVARNLATLKRNHDQQKAVSMPSTASEQIMQLAFPHSRIILVDKGANPGEKIAFLLDNYQLIGYAKVDLMSDLDQWDVLNQRMTTIPANGYLTSLVAQALRRKRLKVVQPR